ncbi:MAG: Xaa-Pro aminopeptidase, partial [Sphingomonadales bacterium]
MKKGILLIGVLALASWAWVGANAQPVLSEREQSKIIDEVLEERFTTILPALMERTGIDMWVIISREYNEDPVLRTMLPSTWLSARRTTMLVYSYDPAQKKVDRLAIARYDVGNAIKAAWDMKKFPDQWDALVSLIEQKKPARIGINTSAHFGHADGLDHTHYEMLMRKLPAAYQSKVVSAEPLAVGWLETRTQREMQYYQKLVAITHEIIAEAFSAKVVTPGVTTTDDLVWWFRQRITSMGLSTWFHPSVSV